MNDNNFIEIINEIKERVGNLKPIEARYHSVSLVIFTAELIRIYMLAGEAIKKIKSTDCNDGFVCEIYNFLDRDFRENKGGKDATNTKKKKLSMKEAGANFSAAYKNLEPIFKKKQLSGLEMTKCLTGLLFMLNVLRALKVQIMAKWPETIEIIKKIEETCYEH